MQISSVDDPIDLTDLAAAIRGSSNFRFAWRFFALPAGNLRSYAMVATALDTIVRRSDLHSFLANSMDDIYPRKFTIAPMHVHASLVLDEGFFLDTIARASLDRLGAYSRDLSPATAEEREIVRRLFGSLGRFYPFHTAPGKSPDCDECRTHSNHLFSNWFFDVAWDYTFLLIWPEALLLWVGCLTDTD